MTTFKSSTSLSAARPSMQLKYLIRIGLLLALALSAATAAMAQATIQNTPYQVKSGTATLLGHYNSNQILRLALGLQPPHPEEERQFLQDVQTVGKGQYHQFLTPQEWTARFDPSVQDEQAVVSWATSQGFSITRRFPNRLIVDVEGTAGTIEKAFNITINSYQVGTRTAYSNDRDPEIPSDLNGILHSVGGLNTIQVMRPANRNLKEPAFPDYSPGPAYSKGTAGGEDGDPSKLPQALKRSQKSGPTPNFTSGTCSSTTTAPCPAYDPQDMFSTAAYDAYGLYNLGQGIAGQYGVCCNPTEISGGTGPNTSIAIATFGAQQTSDFSGFHSTYPYLADHWFIINIDGTPACCDGEGTMDFEWSTAMSNSFGSLNNTASVFMYDAAGYSFGHAVDVYNAMLTDGYARNFSTSWGCEEGWGPGAGLEGDQGCYDQTDADSANNVFASMVGQGWSLTAASGDQGAAAGCDFFGSPHTAVQFPASSPYVVAAGGTTMYLTGGPPPTFNGLTAWSGGPDGCDTNDGGSTGGYSIFFSEPSYQSGLPSRGVPDIALNADWYNTPQSLYFEGTLYTDCQTQFNCGGGTSIVAPETVGFFAQENAYLLWLGYGPVGAVNPYLYGIGYGTLGVPHHPFYDVTTGCNNNDITAAYGLGYYCAGTGWDPVTGWGEYNFLQLAWALNWLIVPPLNYPVANFSGPTTNTWYNSDQEVTWTVTSSADGAAGFSQQWDADPGNPTSEATPGLSGFPGSPYNAFYDGPEYANTTGTPTGTMNGCLDFTGAFCAGNIGGVQGLHTIYVRTFGNEGESEVYTYGPLGYDTIPPVTTSSLSGSLISGTTYKSNVQVTLSASDPGYPSTGSGVNITYYYLNSGGWQVYSGPFSVPYTGSYTVHFFSYDKAGNAETVKTVGFTIKPALSVSPATLAFGNQVLATPSAGKSVTITNITGSSVSLSAPKASGDYTVSSSTCGASLAAGAHCSITVTFKPSIVGSVSGDLTVAYSGGVGSPDRIGLSGTGLVPLATSPTSLAFGTVTVGKTSTAQTLTLKNDNSSNLSINVAYSKDYAAASGGTCGTTLAGGASCTVKVTFTPHQNGAINGAVSVTDGVALSPLVVALSGSGSAGGASPLTFSPTSASFTNVVVGTSSSKSVTVKNVSASSVKITSTLGSGDYSASGCVTTLLPSATCVLTVNFKPSTSGSTKGAIAVTNNTSANPDVLDATGTAILPVTISPASVNLGSWIVGTTSSSATVTVTNHTASAVSIAYPASGDFSAVSGGGTPCSSSLAAGAQCTFLVSTTPTTTGAVTGVVTVTYSAGYSPQEVKLSATGQ